MTYLVLLIILSVAAIYDYKYMKIPNFIFPIACLISIILFLLGEIDKTFLTYITDVLIVFIPLLIIWIIGTLFSVRIMGAGDVKLFSAIPLFISLSETGIILLGSILLASFLNIFKTNANKIKQSLKDLELFLFYGIPSSENDNIRTKIALGPYIFVFTLSYFIYTFLL